MKRKILGCIVTAVTAFYSPSIAQSATISWGANSGNWSTPTDWTGGVVPGAADTAALNTNGVTTTLNSAVSNVMYLNMGTAAAVINSLDVAPGGSLTVAPGATGYVRGIGIGDGGVGSTATVNQTGGSVTAINSSISIGNSSNANGAGVYNISAGTLSTAGTATTTDHTLLVGNKGTGTLNISGTGAVSVGGTRDAGTLTRLSIGYYNTGTVNQTGGSMTVTGGDWVTLGAGRIAAGYSSNGTYNISAGTFSADGPMYMGGATSTWGSGTGILNVSGTGAVSVAQLVVGYTGTGVTPTGTVTQTGGTVDVTGTSGMSIAYSAAAVGTYNLNGGTLTTKQIYKGSGTAAFNIDGGTLKAGGAFTSTMPMTINGNGATIDTNGKAVTLSGGLLAGTGTGGLIKQGGGALTLTGTSTYAGATALNVGTLQIDGSLANTSGVSVATGAVLRGSGSIAGAVSLASGSAIEPGGMGNVGTLTLGGLTLASGTGLGFDLNTTTTSDMISMTSSLLTINGLEFDDFNFNALAGFDVGSYTLIDAGSVSGSLGAATGVIGSLYGTLALSGGDLMLNVTTAVPEPNTLALLTSGLLGLVAYAWRKRK